MSPFLISSLRQIYNLVSLYQVRKNNVYFFPGAAIEKGSFGVVRRAKWLGPKLSRTLKKTNVSIGAIVAVKVLPAGSINSRHFIAFMREVAYATNLRHPNIVVTMGAVTDRWNGLIMEIMSWGSLRASLNDPRRRKFFHDKELYKCIRCICSAGAYLGSVGVIHRDISSKNVFVSTNFETAKLGDFGISSLLEVHLKDRKDPDYGRRLNDHIEVFAGAPAYVSIFDLYLSVTLFFSGTRPQSF